MLDRRRIRQLALSLSLGVLTLVSVGCIPATAGLVLDGDAADQDGDPGGGDGLGGDPLDGDPGGGDALGGDPLEGDPSGGDPGGDPTGGDPGGGDPGGGDPGTPYTVPPTIGAFTCSPETLVAGGTLTLAWSAQNAETLEVAPAVGPVGGSPLSFAVSASGTYVLTATNPLGVARAGCSVVVTPAAPRPVIERFEGPAAVVSGQSGTLTWSTAGATSLQLDGATVTGTSKSVTPASTTSYILTATNAAGSVQATLTVRVLAAVSAPGALGATDVVLTLDSSQAVRSISPYIYGYNAETATGPSADATWLRLGGNRWTAYNWETNASNAGSDWGPYSNDAYLGSASDGPAGGIHPAMDEAHSKNLAVLVTVPIQGWVAADFSGPVSPSAPLSDHFHPSFAFAAGTPSASPALDDRMVFQAELVKDLAAYWAGSSHPLCISLDNEPDLWASTHAEVERSATTYASFISRSLRFAAAIKDQAPDALLLGPVSYGFNGFVNFQNASDAGTYGDFLNFYLDRMRAAGTAQGRRLLDVLDLHWYPEATGCGERISKIGAVLTDCVIAARVQAPRSLFDTSYVETSWIANAYYGNQAIRLIPRVMAQIAAHDPGTRLAFTEYNYGAADHISGGVAQADVLGIFGREGVFGANLWALETGRFIPGAFRIYRNYDGAHATFGDTSFSATSSDLEHVAVYASTDAANAGRVVIVVVHRPTLSGGTLDLRSRTAGVRLSHSQSLTTARAWQLTSSSPATGGVAVPQAITAPTVSSNAFTLTLPALSVTVVELTP